MRNRHPGPCCLSPGSRRRRGRLASIHRDERGAMSVLVLLTVWCLIAVIGMVWNTAEESRRRQKMQAAADSAAHAAATWMARSVNAVTAQNMAICQEASAKTVWLAIEGADQRLTDRLAWERELAASGDLRMSIADAARRIAQDYATIAMEYVLIEDSLKNLATGQGVEFATPQDFIQWNNDYRRANYAVAWLMDSGMAGKELSGGSIQTLDPRQIQKIVLDFLDNQEQQILAEFEGQVMGVRARAVDAETDTRREEIYGHEMRLVHEEFPGYVRGQATQVGDVYNSDVALASLNPSPDYAGSIEAPLTPAGFIPPSPPHTDSIRARYPEDAQSAGLPLTFQIDAINPHTDLARIWHPDVILPVPGWLQLRYNLKSTYNIDCNVPGGWGHTWAAPLERDFFDRVERDRRGVNISAMLRLDTARAVTLANLLRRALGKRFLEVPPLPESIPDPLPDPIQPGRVYVPIPILPPLDLPTKGSFPSSWRQQITLYSQHRQTLLNAVQQLRNDMIGFAGDFSAFTQTFAEAAWYDEVANARERVAQELGAGHFHVLSTYGLRPMPRWARDSMHAAVTLYVEDRITRQNMLQIMRDVHRVPTVIDAARVADYTIKFSQPVIHQAALEIADEWVNRPWPYEITPPEVPVPPFRGMLPRDRQTYFTVMAAARDRTPPRLLMPWLYGSAPSAAYAQAEAFNWMEFNADYGLAERFDMPVSTPWNGDTGFVGSPRPWRTSTIGGWNWRARLGLSDTLSQMAGVNADFAEYLADAGLRADQPAANQVNEH